MQIPQKLSKAAAYIKEIAIISGSGVGNFIQANKN
jgi:hypothetical protein